MSLLKITRNSICNFCISVFVLVSIYTDNNAIMIFSITLLFACVLFSNDIKLRWNVYFTLECLFLLYCVMQLIFESVAVPSISFSMTRRLIINFTSEIVIYNLLLHTKSPSLLYKKYTKPFIVAMLILIGLGLATGTILSGRFSTAGADISIAGIKISVGVGTTIGYLAACAFAMAFITYIFEKKKIYVLFAAIMLVLVLLSGTRKVLLLCGFVFIFIPTVQSKNIQRLVKILKYGALALFVIILVMKVPYLYSVLGIRLERTIQGFVTGEVVDNSEIIRKGLRVTAMNAIAQKPLYGWGLASFKELFGNGIYSHSNYVEIFYSCGIVGGLIFYSRYVYLLVSMLISLKHSKNESEKYYLMSGLVLFLSLAVMEYWQVTYYLEKFTLIYVFMVTLSYMVKRDIFHRIDSENSKEKTCNMHISKNRILTEAE